MFRFSTAMSPNSPCRNHNWLPLLQITEQSLIQTMSRTVAAVCASEANKMFNVIFHDASLWASPTSIAGHYPIYCLLSKHLPIGSSAFLPSIWSSCCWGVSPHGTKTVCWMDLSLPETCIRRVSPHILKEDCFLKATGPARGRSSQARISNLLRFSQMVKKWITEYLGFLLRKFRRPVPSAELINWAALEMDTRIDPSSGNHEYVRKKVTKAPKETSKSWVQLYLCAKILHLTALLIQ